MKPLIRALFFPSLNLTRIVVLIGILAAPILPFEKACAQAFIPGDLLVSRSVYAGSSSTVTIGQTLPGGGTAVVDGSYPGVFANEGPDPSFGITAPIFIDEMTPEGSVVSTLTVPTSDLVTSFSSKSELSLTPSTDGSAITFMGYIAPVNTLDVSNSNTPGHVDATNPVAGSYQRAVAQLNADGSLTVTPVNAYSGNNGREAILATNVNGTGQSYYYTVGNAGNGSGTEPANIVDNTGLQMTTPGGSAEMTPVGAQQGTPGSSNGFQFGYSVANNGLAADKSGKDNNFRSLTVFNNTLYVAKGSGSNGINSVYQVGPGGTLPTAANANSLNITVLPGLNTTSAKTAVSPSNPASNPFGLYFANSSTLYIADEGDGIAADLTNGNDPNSGLQKWSLVNGTWQLDYVLKSGLNLGQSYAVSGYTGSVPATDGLRTLTGVVNGDGTVTFYAVTSTVSTNTDQGADPNQLVSITDVLADTTSGQVSGESFNILETASNGEVLRGVSLTPQTVPEPSTYALFFGAAAAVVFVFKRHPKNQR